MESSLKIKVKNKDKIKKIDIEEGIPDPPNLTDFNELYESSNLNFKHQHSKHQDNKETKNIPSEINSLRPEEKEENKNFNCNEQKQPCSLEQSKSLNLCKNKSEIDQFGFNSTDNNYEKFKKNNETDCNKFNESQNLVEKTIVSSVNYSYSNLEIQLKKIAQENEKPSAPRDVFKDEKQIQNICDFQNLQISQDCKEKKVIDLENYSFTMCIEDPVLPYSDEKLCKLYFNPELQESKKCIEDIVYQEISNKAKENSYLFKLLMEYVQSKNSLKENEKKIHDNKKMIDTCIFAMWTSHEITVNEKEYCCDNILVSFSQKYTQAQFNSNIHKEFIELLEKVNYIIFQPYSVNLLKCSFLKVKIAYYLQKLLTSCPEFTELEKNSPAFLNMSSKNSHFNQCVSDLKRAISTLFIFQRNQFVEVDESFLKESREWLSDLVAVLLRIGNWRDHIFLLSHIMRCPGGVNEWAVPFLQVPISIEQINPFNDSQINHAMTVLHTILSPINLYENFTEKWESEILNESNPWTVIDSDGEIEGDTNQQLRPLKENDFIAFLNQIPFSSLFRALFCHENKEILGCSFSCDYFLKLISFSTELIKTLHNGLQLFHNLRYKQFTKRLGQLIYHNVEYVTQVLSLLKSQKISKEELIRITVEYDNFFLKASKFIYSAKKHGTWQFLATMPYSELSSNAILKLYGILQLNDDKEENLIKVHFSSFKDNFLQLPEEEQFYLLTTLGNMALARHITELHFIKNILLQLFYVGFANPSTMDHCYKTTTYLLFSICSLHPLLISEILSIQQQLFQSDPNQDQKLSTFLWRKLPVLLWKPNKMDLEILSEWLLEPVQYTCHELARIIFDSLNYGMNQNELFMPAENHRAIALTLLQANIKFCNENDQSFIKNISTYVRLQGIDESINEWIWKILIKLRLHLLDDSEAKLFYILPNIVDYLKNIPDVESNVNLYHSVLKKNSIACFIALMTTTLGHSMPIIIEKGFDLIEVLFNAGKYEPGIACLEFIILQFLKCDNSLHKCQKFISLLLRIIANDNSYVQYAKNLISNNIPGPTLKCLECMIQNQLNYYKSININEFNICLEFWLLSLTKIPMWPQEPSVLYLIDKLIQNSFFDYKASKIVKTILESLSEDDYSINETKSSLSSLVDWLNSKYKPPSLLPKGFNGEIPWFSYQIIRMDFEIHEKKNLLWLELLKELHSTRDKKTNVDSSLKKVCNHFRIPTRPSSSLAIYKWVYQILKTDIAHPLLPLIWQQFFLLYFNRVPGSTDLGSVGEKFFDGVLNQSLLKQLKQRLTETFNYFKDVCKKNEEAAIDDCNVKYLRLFQTYSLWIEDKNLHNVGVNIHLFPSEYNPKLLELLFHGSDTPWIEFIEYENIEKSFEKASLDWRNYKNRLHTEKENKMPMSKKEKNKFDDLNEKLKTYETPLPPPQVCSSKYEISEARIRVLICSDKIFPFIKHHVDNLLLFKELYTFSYCENLSLGSDMQELLPKLYFNVQTQKVLKNHCNGVQKTIDGKSAHFSCSGPAVCCLRYEESKLNEKVQVQVEQAEKSFSKNIQKVLSSLPDSIKISSAMIDIAIEELKKEYHIACNQGNESQIVLLKRTGVNLFYEFIQNWYNSAKNIHPLKIIFDFYIDTLGQTFIISNADEIKKLVQLILSNDIYDDNFCKYFNPNISSIQNFIEHYYITLESSSKRKVGVLSKFDLIQFLVENKPKFSERSRLIFSIGQGLITAFKEENQNHDLIQLLNQHLNILLLYDFPEHYGEVLNFLLSGSQNQNIAPSTWFMFLNSLTFGNFVLEEGQSNQKGFEPGQSIKQLKCFFSKFALDQNKLPFEVLKGTVSLLASTFKNERLKAGSCGLYRKYYPYLEPLFIFFGMLSYSCVAKTVETDSGSLCDKITQKLWPLLNDLYSPWLIPYFASKENKASSPHKEADGYDKHLYLPWTINDSCYAFFGASIFVESIRFILDTLPGINNILSYFWVFYATNFANAYVKDYVLNVIHECFSSLPWEIFFPSLQDLELMLNVVGQFLPLSHSFLGNIFINVKWTEVIQHFSKFSDTETLTKIHICLLHLLVKLPLEPSLKQNEKVINILNDANEYSWYLIDAYNYEVVLNWFVMSCDPRIILMDQRLEYFKLDSTILRLLQTCAGYVPTAKLFHPTTVTKRLMFTKASVKWLASSNKRFKSKDSPLFKISLYQMWETIESVLIETVPHRIDEASILVSEVFVLFKEPELSTLVIDSLTEWLSKRKSQVVVFGLLKTAATIESPDNYGQVVEAALENYFSHWENSSWSEIIQFFMPFSKSAIRLEKVLIDGKNFLTLHGTLLKKFSKNEEKNQYRLIITDLLQLLTEVKLSVSLEPKMLLLVVFILKLIDEELKTTFKEGLLLLTKFCVLINGFIMDRGTGFLSTVGLSRSSISEKFKLICLIMYSGIIIFLKKNYPDYEEAVDDKVLKIFESTENNKAYNSVQQYVFYSKSVIKNINTIENIICIVNEIALKIFDKFYLK